MGEVIVKAFVKTVKHLLFWIGVWFFFYYFFSFNSNDKTYIIWFSSLLLPLTAALTYFVTYFLIPKYLLTKRYFLFGLYGFYTLVFASYLIVLVIYGCLIFLLSFNVSVMPPMSKNFLFILILVFLIIGVVGFAHLLKTNFKTMSINKELENKILATQLQLKEQELHYLKMQIHPHFLFNTLNTIYGLALKQSKHTPDVILKLSNLLDYILYGVDKPLVNLTNELEHIEEYIGLEKIRFQDTLKVNFNAQNINPDFVIAPMLLIPFIENAFKHGNIVDGYLNIEIKAECSSRDFYFVVRNSVVEEEMETAKGGIGLENVKKRLRMNYPDTGKLVTKFEDNQYIAELTITDINKKTNHD